MKKRLFFISLICILFGWVTAHATIISTFDLGNENWTFFGFATLSHSTSGGNSGGFLKATEDGASSFGVVAPTKFLGDLSSLNGGTLSFDSKVISTNSQDNYTGFGKVTITGGGFSAVFDVSPNPPGTDWATYSARLIASSWGVDETTWGKILANITKIEVVLEAFKGYEIMGFDNFKVQSAQSVPEPASLLLLGAGLACVGFFRRRLWRAVPSPR